MAYHIYLNISIHKMDDVSCCPFEWFSVRPLCFLSLCTALIHRASQQFQLKEQGKKKSGQIFFQMALKRHQSAVESHKTPDKQLDKPRLCIEAENHSITSKPKCFFNILSTTAIWLPGKDESANLNQRKSRTMLVSFNTFLLLLLYAVSAYLHYPLILPSKCAHVCVPYSG